MRDLGTVGTDLNSAAQGINERGQIVGSSYDTLMQSRAFLSVHGKLTDLNTLVCGDSSLYLLVALGINTGGEIAGFGVAPSTGEVHGYLATPCNRCNEGVKDNVKAVLSDHARRTLTEHLRHYYHMGS
jgi:probable HAF family extracellular repeat protein